MEKVIKFPAQEAEAQTGAQSPAKSLPLCTVQELAEATGVSEQTIRRYIREGEIPAIHVGRRLLILTDKLMDGGEGNE